MSVEPLVSTANSWSEGFSAMTPLQEIRGLTVQSGLQAQTHPWITWSRTSSSPDWICVTSTFLRQAFFPLRLGCLYWAGAASVLAMLGCSVRTTRFAAEFLCSTITTISKSLSRSRQNSAWPERPSDYVSSCPWPPLLALLDGIGLGASDSPHL